jgi:cell division septation protein DedD
MDWMRRNWPDLLIVLALLLVIGGIIATLLNGGNFLPFGRNPQPAPINSNPTTDTTPEAVPPSDPNNPTTSTNGVEVAPVDLNSTEPVSVGEETGTIVPVPPSTDETPTGDAATAAIDNAAITPVNPETDTTTATPTDTGDTAQVAASNSSTAPYRISVGAFGNAENAERKAQSFRDVGYPVFVGQQGDLSLVLVGPYDSQAEAEQVKAQLQSSGLEANPIVYEFRPEDAGVSGTSSTEAVSTETAPNPSTSDAATDTTSATSAETTATSALPTSTSGRYLQVGAYGSLEAAAPQRSLLEGLGFNVSSVEEGSFVKLLVGPYDDANLGAAQSRLSAQGIDNFVR